MFRLRSQQPLPKRAVKTFRATSAAETTAPPQYLSAPQLVAAYNVVPVIPRVSQKTTVAVIVAFSYPGVKADLATYWTHALNYGPQSTPPTIQVKTMPGATFRDDWAREECLDVQMVAIMNPNANIWVVEARSDSLDDLGVAVMYATMTLRADVVSMSWGCDDTPDNFPYNRFFFSNLPTCFCAASGDSNTVSWPAVLPNVLAVGGSTLFSIPGLRSEVTWNGAGCGYSATCPQPNYQTRLPGITHTQRVIPDVSLTANPTNSVYTVYKGQWSGIGGTSVGTPLMAGILSLANQSRFNAGKPTAMTTVYTPTPLMRVATKYTTHLNHLQTYLYASRGGVTLDIVSGQDLGSSSTSAEKLVMYTAGTGYDVPTGLGAPNCANLCKDLAAL